MTPIPAFFKRRGNIPSAGGGGGGGGGGGSSLFGTLLQTRILPSTGTEYFVAPTGNDTTGDGSIGNPWRTIQKAFNTVSTIGSIINLRAGTYDNAADQLIWSRAGSSSNPVTLRNYPGETATIRMTTVSAQFLISGSYLRVKGEPTLTSSRLIVTASSATDARTGFKTTSGAHHFEIDGVHIHSLGNMGILFGGGGYSSSVGVYDVSDIQIWNTRINNIGDIEPNQNHGMYFDSVQRLTVANCLVYDNYALGLQMYPHCDSCVVTASTIDSHPAAGPILCEGDGSGRTTNNKIIGCSLSVASLGDGWSAVMARFNGSGNQVMDCNGYNVTTPSFQHVNTGTVTNCASGSVNPLYTNQGARDYRPQAGSPLINLAAARIGYIPATDMLGNPRTTADAGCYAR